MQTSGNGSFCSTRMAGVAAAIGLAIVATGNWLACSPGVVDCDRVDCGGSNGSNTGGGSGNTGGTGGKAPATVEDPPSACGSNATGTGEAAISAFETKFIAPKCGQAMCHGPKAVFQPKMLDMVDQIRPALVGVKAALLCKNDYYINKTDPSKSFVLAKITSTTDNLPCPSAPMGKADAGGTRMPNKDGSPGTVGDMMAADDIECFTWYINNVIKL
jgi:hypothetical protein